MQNFKNHSRLYPLHHFILTPITVALVVWSLINIINSNGSLNQNLFNGILAFTLALTLLVSRIYALKNQDRIIRMEMRLRYFELTGKSFAEKEAQLRLGQIIALRFAGDDELLALIDNAIAEKSNSKYIKASIKNWKPDHRRV